MDQGENLSSIGTPPNGEKKQFKSVKAEKQQISRNKLKAVLKRIHEALGETSGKEYKSGIKTAENIENLVRIKMKENYGLKHKLLNSDLLIENLNLKLAKSEEMTQILLREKQHKLQKKEYLLQLSKQTNPEIVSDTMHAHALMNVPDTATQHKEYECPINENSEQFYDTHESSETVHESDLHVAPTCIAEVGSSMPNIRTDKPGRALENTDLNTPDISNDNLLDDLDLDQLLGEESLDLGPNKNLLMRSETMAEECMDTSQIDYTAPEEDGTLQTVNNQELALLMKEHPTFDWKAKE